MFEFGEIRILSGNKGTGIEFMGELEPNCMRIEGMGIFFDYEGLGKPLKSKDCEVDSVLVKVIRVAGDSPPHDDQAKVNGTVGR